MSYLTTQEIRDAIKASGRTGEEFFEVHPEEELDELIDDLERRSRAIINGQLKGEGYERQTDRVDTVDAPDKPTIQLVYPVDKVSKVEISNRPGEFRELDTDLYSNDEQKIKVKQSLIDREHPFQTNRNPLTRNSRRATWAGICERVRITYDRGYETSNIPFDLKEVQQDIIRRMLVHYRQEQNLANLNPDEAQAFNTRQILTDDIMQRIDQITQTKHKYLMLR